ncbi:hypothetical protein EDB83DRAFT_438763 [Lactarius deliciosus]|nr:hypothetical protein EDB83DRAFT_438763 [Lactarius deliciosus]
MHRRNNSAYPSPSLNHNRLPDRSLDISPTVLPCSIARQPRLPYTHLSLFTGLRPSRRRPRRGSLHQSRPQTSTPSQASRCRTRPHRDLDPLARTQPPALVARSSRSRAQITRDAITAALVPPPPTLPPQLQPITMICRMRVWISTSNTISMDLGDGPVHAGEDESADTHGVVVGDAPPRPPPPLLRTADTHNHPDGPVLGFVIPEHDDVDHSLDASVDVGRALTSPSQGLSFDLTSSNRGGEGSID